MLQEGEVYIRKYKSTVHLLDEIHTWSTAGKSQALESCAGQGA